MRRLFDNFTVKASNLQAFCNTHLSAIYRFSPPQKRFGMSPSDRILIGVC